MKKFLLSLINANDPNSSKRFAGLTTLFSTIILAFIATAKSGWVCPVFMYNGLLMVIAGLFGFNMAENIFMKSKGIIDAAPIVAAPTDTTTSVVGATASTPDSGTGTQVDTPEEG